MGTSKTSIHRSRRL